MRRATYEWLTTTLIGISAALMLGTPLIAAAVDHLEEDLDILLALAFVPGGFILGGLIYLCNGLIEYYADLLPSQYRARSSQREHWQAIFASAGIGSVQAALEGFASSNDLRPEDAFQFHPEDRLWTVFGDLYPNTSYPDCLEACCADSMDEPDRELAQLMDSNATLSEYVTTAMRLVEGS